MKTLFSFSDIFFNIFNTKRYLFLIVTYVLVSMILLCLGKNFFKPMFHENMMRVVIEQSNKIANHILVHEKEYALNDNFIAEINLFKKTFDIEKIKYFDKDGITIYSTSTEEIGKVIQYDYFFEIVAKNNVFYEIVHKGKESLEGEISSIDVVEVYVPIMKNGLFSGAFEFYFNIYEQENAFNEIIEKIYLIYYLFIGVLAMMIMLCLYYFSKISLYKEADEKSIKNLNSNLQRKTQELEELNGSLDYRIKEEILKRQEQEAIVLQQSRSAAMGEMISMIAHQWRQPISALKIILQSIEYKINKSDRSTIDLNYDIQKSTKVIDQMSQTIDDFKDFFKPNKKKKRFVIDKCIHKAIEMLLPGLNSHEIKVQIDFEQKGIEVYGFMNELSQVIINLVSNSKDALLEHGVSDPCVSIKISKSEDFVKITVCDNGGGISLQHMSKLFEPYFSTKDEKNGTGLGLYMSKIIIEKNMNGKIDVHNAHEGAEFTLYVPLLLAN